MKFGIDRLLNEPELRKPLAGRRVALLAHPASLTRDLYHSLDALATLGEIRLTAAFGPQHGLRGDKQDNMVESPDCNDPVTAFRSSASMVRCGVRPPTMMDTFDVLLVDLQDLGCRIYTFVTTLLYVLEEAAKYRKEVWILDRPNPVGRPVEGLTLRPGCESFVGAGPMPMRHGLTFGEMARWFVATLRWMLPAGSFPWKVGCRMPPRVWLAPFSGGPWRPRGSRHHETHAGDVRDPRFEALRVLGTGRLPVPPCVRRTMGTDTWPPVM